MTIACELCGTELEETSDAAIAMKLEKAINWDSLEYKSVGTSVNAGTLGVFRIEAIKIKPTLDDLSDTGYGYYGGDEYPQGTEYQTYIVLSLGDSFFKKTGQADSYGEITWAGVVKPTKPKQVTVTSWE